jgi:hypothetical protein
MTQEGRSSVDPITVLVTAIVAGAASGLKPTAERVVKDAYAGLRRLIVDRYHQVALESIERAPDILRAAKELLATIEANPAASTAVEDIGVSLERVKAASLSISEIEGGRTGVRLRNVDIVDDIVIKGVRTGDTGDPKVE